MSDDGNIRATDASKSAVKFVVAGEARRSWPAGGSAALMSITVTGEVDLAHAPFANVVHGDASAQAICSGCAAEMMAVWPGVSISCTQFRSSVMH